ncbi:MAG: hypothetical protein GY739_10450 [Mesoflavibacter sp.]|nr:hypothetical protein [Mesoflavibacter sp.]
MIKKTKPFAFSSDFYGFYEREGNFKKIVPAITNVFNTIFNKFVADNTDAKSAITEIKALMIVFDDYGADDTYTRDSMYLVLEEIFPDYDFTDTLL